MKRPFHFSHFEGVDGTILVNDRDEVATEQDMERFWRMAEPELDRLTLELCAYERKQGNKIDKWLLDAELEAFNRTRKRAAA